MNKSILQDINDTMEQSGLLLPKEVGSLFKNLRNCVESAEAGAMMNDDQKLNQIAYSVAELVEAPIAGYELAHTVWNVLCWLRDSMRCMMFLRNFSAFDMIKHDLSVVPINQIMPLIKSKMSDLFDEKSVHYKHAVRYLSVLHEEILIDKGVS